MALTARGRALLFWAPAGLGAALAALAALVAVSLPPGAEDAVGASRARVLGRARAGSAQVLAVRRWGEGALTFTRYLDHAGRRRLALAFVVDRGRGWRAVAATDPRAEPTDVTVGSLLVTTSAGGRGQPPWSAVWGELADPRIRRVEVEWRDGSRTAGLARARAYLLLRRGVHRPRTVRYLSAEGGVLATVPADDAGP